MGTLNDNLKLLRNKSGYTQQEVAEKLYVTRQCVSRWEQGITVPDINNLKKLAEIYNCSIEEVLDDEALRSFTLDTVSTSNKNRRFLYIILSVCAIILAISITSILISINKPEQIYTIRAIIVSIDDLNKEIGIKEETSTEVIVLDSKEFKDIIYISEESNSMINFSLLNVNDTIELSFKDELSYRGKIFSQNVTEIRVVDEIVEDNFLGVVVIANGVEYSSIVEFPENNQGIRYYYEIDSMITTNFSNKQRNINYYQDDSTKDVDLVLDYDLLKLSDEVKIGLIYESGIEYTVFDLQTFTMGIFVHSDEHNYSDNIYRIHSYNLDIQIQFEPRISFKTIEILEYNQNNTLIDTYTFTSYLDINNHNIDSDTIYIYVIIYSDRQVQQETQTIINTMQIFLGETFEIYSCDDFGFVYSETVNLVSISSD